MNTNLDLEKRKQNSCPNVQNTQTTFWGVLKEQKKFSN